MSYKLKDNSIAIKSFNKEQKDKVAKLIYDLLWNYPNYPYKLLKRLIKDLLWSATEDDNKGDSLKYKIPVWSPMAIEHYKTEWEKTHQGLRHEHMYPKGLFYKNFFTKKNKKNKPIALPLNKIKKLINIFSHAAIIHETEEKKFRYTNVKKKTDRTEKLVSKIPKDFHDSHDIVKIFSRYIVAEIELKVVRFIDNKIQPLDFILRKKNKKMIINETALKKYCI